MAGSNRCWDTGCLGRGCSCFVSVHSGVCRVNLQRNTASCSLFVVHQSSSWCRCNLRPRKRLRTNSLHLCRQAHLSWRLDKILCLHALFNPFHELFTFAELSWNLKCHYLVHKSSHIGLYQRHLKPVHTLRPYWSTVPFWYRTHSFLLCLDILSGVA